MVRSSSAWAVKAACSWRRPRTRSSQLVDQSVSSNARRRRGHGVVEILGPGVGHHPDDLLGGRVEHLEGPARPGRPELPADEHALLAGRQSGGGRHQDTWPRPKTSSVRRSAMAARGSSTSERLGQLEGGGQVLVGQGGTGLHRPHQPLVVGVGERRHGGAEHEAGGASDVDVAGLDHLGQFGQGDSRRLGQLLALVGGQPRAVGDQVPGQLGGESGTEGSHGHGQGADGVEHRCGPFDHRRIAPHHAHQVAAGGGGRAAGHPAVEDGHAEGVGLGADGVDARRGDGADHNDDGARSGRGQAALGARQHGMDLLVVDHGHHHHLGPTHQVGRGGRHPGPVGVPVGGLGPHIADHQWQALAQHAGGHATSDVAEADDADGRCAAPSGLVGWLVVGHGLPLSVAAVTGASRFWVR